MANDLDEIFGNEARIAIRDCKCASCLFGVLAPDRRTQGKRTKRSGDEPQSVYHCSINPPFYPSGFPVVEAGAVCAMFATREDEPKQPLRSLTFPNGNPGFTLTMKG